MTLETLPNGRMGVYSTEENFKHAIIQFVGRKKAWWKPKAFQRKIYRLAVDYYLEWGPVDARKRIYHRAGFEYDRASIPRLMGFSSLIGFDVDAENDTPSKFHDRMCRDRGYWTTGEFEFETQNAAGEWQRDSSRWRPSEVHDFFGFVCRMGGMSAARAAVQVSAVKAWLLGGYGK